MAIEERGKSVSQFGLHPVEQKIAAYHRAASYSGIEDCGNEIMSLMYMHTFDTRRLAEATEAVVLQMTSPWPGACDSS